MQIIYIEFLNKAKNFTKDSVEFTGKNAYSEAVAWGRTNIENFNLYMLKWKK